LDLPDVIQAAMEGIASGQDIYQALTDHFGGSKEQASKFLMSNGLKGIRYLDATSRYIEPQFDKGINKWIVQAGPNEWMYDTREEAEAKSAEFAQTRNYVVFDGSTSRLPIKW
jgi:hypothetical protein